MACAVIQDASGANLWRGEIEGYGIALRDVHLNTLKYGTSTQVLNYNDVVQEG